MGLNWLDSLFFVLIILSLAISLARGLLREVISLATWVIAFWVALSVSDTVAEKLRWLTHSASLRLIMAFIIVFMSIWLLGLLINIVVKQLIYLSRFGLIDRLLGAGFGVLRGILLVGVVVLLGNITTYAQQKDWQASAFVRWLTPYTNEVHAAIQNEHGEKPDGVDDQSLRERLQQLHHQALS